MHRRWRSDSGSDRGVVDLPISEREQAFVKAFVVRNKRDRYLSLLGNPRKRSEILDALNHGPGLDWTFGLEHPKYTIDGLEALLLGKGARADSCYLIADQLESDGCQVGPAGGDRGLRPKPLGMHLGLFAGAVGSLLARIRRPAWMLDFSASDLIMAG